MTTQLQAVNELLEAIGESPVSALETGLATDAGHAETILDRERLRVLRFGWAQNEEEDLKLHFASVSLTGTITLLQFIKGERVTQATSGAIGIITESYGVSAVTYLICPIDGSVAFNGAGNITGQTSNTVTDTISAVTNPTSGIIQVEDDVLRLSVEPMDHWRKVTMRDARLYDRDDSTGVFAGSIRCKIHRDLVIAQLTSALAEYVVQQAAFRYQRFKKRGVIDDAMVKETLAMARISALQEESDMRAANSLNTPETRGIKGNRKSYHGTESVMGW